MVRLALMIHPGFVYAQTFTKESVVTKSLCALNLFLIIFSNGLAIVAILKPA